MDYMLSEHVQKIILGLQRDEITEHIVYRKLAEKSKGKNAEILKTISNDELLHYNKWKKYTQAEVNPDEISVSKYLIFSVIFGLMFVMKIMERGEEEAQEAYNRISAELSEAKELLQDEIKHEKFLIDMIDEKRLDYVGSIVQGLNDALVGLMGQLAGFTLALQNTQLIGFAGLIAGIAQFLSNSTSEIEIYFSQRTEENKETLKASVYSGLVYISTVVILLMPYFLSTNYYVTLLVTLLTTSLIIVFFTFYISVVKTLPLRKMFLTMILATLGVSGASFVIGWIVKVALKL